MHGSGEMASGTRHLSQEILLDYCRTLVRADEQQLRVAMEQYAQALRAETLHSKAA